MNPRVECESCGTAYAVSVLEKLPGGVMQRLSRGPDNVINRYTSRQCLCGGKVVTATAEPAGLVLVVHRGSGPWDNSRTYALKPTRCTKTRIYFRAPWGAGESELAYNLSDGSEHGGRGGIKESELKLAMTMLAGKKD